MKKLTILTLLQLLLVYPPARGQPAQNLSPEPVQPKHEYKEQKGHLPNFHEVHSYLFRGGEPTAAGLKKLHEQGFKTIIDLRAHPGQVKQEAKLVETLGMKSINLPMSSKAPTERQIKIFMDTVEEAAKDPQKGPVFVHCAHGSDRTGCLIGLWRVKKEGWTYDQAYREMRKYYFSPKFTELSGTVRRFAGDGATH